MQLGAGRSVERRPRPGGAAAVATAVETVVRRSAVVESGQSRPEVVGETVRAYDVAVARLVNSIGKGISEFDHYFRESGIVELPDDCY